MGEELVLEANGKSGVGVSNGARLGEGFIELRTVGERGKRCDDQGSDHDRGRDSTTQEGALCELHFCEFTGPAWSPAVRSAVGPVIS